MQGRRPADYNLQGLHARRVPTTSQTAVPLGLSAPELPTSASPSPNLLTSSLLDLTRKPHSSPSVFAVLQCPTLESLDCAPSPGPQQSLSHAPD